MIDVVPLGKGHGLIQPIDGTRTGKDQISRLLRPTSLQHIQHSFQVALRIGVRMGQAVPHPRLRGQMNHHLRLGFLPDFFYPRSIPQIRP